MAEEKTEYTAEEAAEILGINVRTVLYHKNQLAMGLDWWYNERREFRCSPEAIETLKNRTTRGKYLRKKK
jgi:hypothetical protein